MSRVLRFFAGVLLFVVTLVMMGLPPAFAQPAPPREESPGSRGLRQSLNAPAREKFDEGTRLYRQSRFSEAREAFMAAQALSGELKIFYNVAVCDKALGRYARAITVLKRSLPGERTDDPAYQQRVEDTIAALSRHVAFVTIAAAEGAVITVDGEPLASNPLPLETGSHAIVATKEGYERATVTINVVGGQDQRVDVRLEPAVRPGVANIACAVPRCQIRVGGEMLGPAPVTLQRESGSYLVQAVRDGRVIAAQNVQIVNGKSIDVDLAALAPAPAHLRVTTDQADDAVSVDGERVGRSGIEVELSPGEHRVFIARTGGPSRQIDVLLREGETRDLRVTLEEKRGMSGWWLVGAGVLVTAAAVTTAAILASDSSSSTRYEGNGAGTLNPYVVPARFGGAR